jgi:uncharacterized protein YcfJ
MKSFLKNTLTMVAMGVALQVSAQVTIYEHDDFQGRSYTSQRPINNFERNGFNDRASSIVVAGERWEACEDIRFGGRCVILRPGRYASLGVMNLNDRISSIRPIARGMRVADNRYAPEPAPAPTSATRQVVFYENEDFGGRSFAANQPIADFNRFGFNDRASSAMVYGERWEACTDNQFGGQCVVLRPGRYPSLAAMGMNDRISSVRAVESNARIDDNRFAPAPAAVYDNRRRNDEPLYEANVSNVRAVMAVAGQRCWMEREQVQQNRQESNVGGAIVGGLIGGILGHQVGGGVGKDLATVGGAVAGAAVGAQVGRDNNGQQTGTRDVQRCANEPGQAKPAYWDVSYNFRGQDHRVQMTSAPGATITVNGQGEPRS